MVLSLRALKETPIDGRCESEGEKGRLLALAQPFCAKPLKRGRCVRAYKEAFDIPFISYRP